MEIKFVVIFVLLGLIIFLIIKEMTSLKNQMNASNDKVKYLICTSSKEIEQKLKSNFNSCIDRIKLINGDYMVQIRKMNELGKEQIITTHSNNYSDSESQVKNKENKILYLSEGCGSIQKKDFQINYTDAKSDKKNAKSDKKEENDVKMTNNFYSTTSVNENLNEDSNEDTDEDTDNSSSDSSLEESTSSSRDNSDEDEDVNIEIESEIEYSDIDKESENKNKNTENDKKTNSSSKKSVFSSQSHHSSPVKEINFEEESILTNDVNLSLNNLLPAEKYNKKFLEKVAKNFGIATYYKDGDKRKILLKEDLYEKIKEKLEKN
jgi:hypothetical protein